MQTELVLVQEVLALLPQRRGEQVAVVREEPRRFGRPLRAALDGGTVLFSGGRGEGVEVRQGREWGVLYDEFLDPAGRAAIARPAFLAKRGGGFDILGFEVLRAEVQAETQPPRGKVQVQLDALIPVLMPGGGSQTVRRSVEEPQQWVFRDGGWYIQLRK